MRIAFTHNLQRTDRPEEAESDTPETVRLIEGALVSLGHEVLLVDVLGDLARFYEEEIDQVTKNLSSIIEPVLMVIIGVAVGFFAISMLMPMYSVMDSM